jgi:hypothetical protein
MTIRAVESNCRAHNARAGRGGLGNCFATDEFDGSSANLEFLTKKATSLNQAVGIHAGNDGRATAA